MREILFRAWDKELGLSEIFSLNYYPIWNGETKPYWANLCSIEQFTGLVDRNGKRIFEGDIFTSDYFDDTYNFEVVFSDGAFCGKHKSTGIYMLGFTNYDDNGEDLGYWCEEDYTSHIQVIGNIHDNPELVEAR